MKYNIIVQNEVANTRAPKEDLLSQWAIAALAACDQTEAELTIRIASEAEMSELNTLYRKKVGTTNVLSFPFEIEHDLPGYQDCYLGDIIICEAVVHQEAITQEKAVNDHWAHMVIHGIFHLLGYDHQSEDEANIMEALEIKTLKKLGAPNPYLTGEKIEHHD